MTANAQTARQILDQTSAKLQKSGGLQATFTATTYKGLQVTGSSTGSICVQGNKFKLTTTASTTWFNGKTQWAMMQGSDEAYVSTPTEAELQSVNPYTFINLYKSGYTLTTKKTTYGGKPCHEVELNATGASGSIERMIVTVDASTYLPRCVRIKPRRGEWVRLQVTGLSTGKKWSQKFFEFSEKDYPAVEVIDLR